MKATIFTILAATALICSCNSKKDAAEQEKKDLLLLNNQYDSALVLSDTARLDNLYAPEFTYITPEGQVRTKAEQMETISSGGLDLNYGKSEEVDIQVYDNTALLSGRFTGKGVFKGTIIDINERYTSVWVKKDDAWKLVKEHSTLIK